MPPASTGNEMFRKAALDRLSSPDQLDMLLQVTRTPAWLGLGGLVMLVGAAILWGLFGTIPTNVQAEGILVSRGGVFDVFAGAGGTVAEVAVKEGDAVDLGQVVARIDQPELERQLENARAELAEIQASHADLQAYTNKDIGLRTESLVVQRAKLQDTIAFSQDRLKAVGEQIAGEEQLLERGLITKQSLLQTRQTYFSTKDQLDRARNDIKQLDVQELSTRSQSDQEVGRSQQRMRDTGRRIGLLEAQLERSSTVKSPYRGSVVEIRVNRGDVLRPGLSVLSLRLADVPHAGGALETLIYVRPTDGKSIVPGMEVQISPSTAQKEEFGYLVGRVTYVSEFPSTGQGMMRVLSNEELVKRLSGDGAPFAIYADLEPDPQAVSGYRWSSLKGREVKVASGTLCNVSVTTRKRRPISLVIPLLREYTGL
jgi:HlyD family secretion protein